MNENKMLLLPDGTQLDSAMIIYICMRRNYAEFHLVGGKLLKVRVTMSQLKEQLGPDFVKIHRSVLVSVRAIHDITDTVNLSNGETLGYAANKKEWLKSVIQERKKTLLQALPEGDQMDYREHYRAFDILPIAFTDIEMVFDEQNCALDWIFRYANPAMAQLEKLPLETMIGASFSSLFPDMDTKWLQSYERAAIQGETLEIIDYSSEIDTYLRIICFPTFPGHCGCILFDVSAIHFGNPPDQTIKAMLIYLTRMEQ